MRWRPLLIVSAALLAALSLLIIGGLRVLARDRDALVSRFAHDREVGLQEAARGLASDLTDVADDLDLAAAVLHSADTTQLAERELHAIATIKREYLAMHARTDDGVTTKVVALDAPPRIAETTDASLDAALDRAEEQRGVLHVASIAGSPWLRVMSRRPEHHGPAVAVVVDMAVLLGRLKVQRDPMSRLAVLDAKGVAAALSDRPFVDAMRAQPDAMRDGTVDGAFARSLGLPATAAIAIAVPLEVDAGKPWSLRAVVSTQPLQHQERIVVQRVMVGGALVLLLLVSAAAYVLYNTFRARALRERLKMEQRLLHSEKLALAGQLAAGIAHEIGTPLNVARGRVELALSHLGATHAEADNHRIVMDQIDRVTRLIQQLLDYVRPTPARVEPVDLGEALRVATALLAPQATKRKVKLHVDSADATARVTTDPDQLQQIIVNLTLNAVDACEPGGSVQLRARSSPTTVMLEVTDDGHGISPEIRKQVFDPFFTTKKRGQGTGLGLWVVAQLATAQNAEIELDSVPQKGTTVRVVWPVP